MIRLANKIWEATFGDLKRKQRSITNLFPTFHDRVAKVGEKGGVRLLDQNEDTWELQVHSGTKDDVWYEDTVRFRDIEAALTKAAQSKDVWNKDKTKFDFRRLAKRIFKVADLQLSCSCLAGETKISVFGENYRSLSINQIFEEFGTEKDFVVLSSDEEGRTVFSRARCLGVTKEVDSLTCVTLNNGEVVRCTEDHLFRLHSGEYLRADCLGEGDSLLTGTIIGRKLEKENCRIVRSVSTVKLVKPEPVYDLTVDTHQNFLLSSGVFVHNCPAQLYWGGDFILSQDKYDAKVPPPEDRSPDIRNPRKYGAFCKHLQAVFKVLPFYHNTLARWLKTYHGPMVEEIEAEYSRQRETFKSAGQELGKLQQDVEVGEEEDIPDDFPSLEDLEQEFEPIEQEPEIEVVRPARGISKNGRRGKASLD